MSTNEKVQEERRNVIRRDHSARTGATLSDFATADASIDRGRYSHVSKPTIIKSGPDYPKASGPWDDDPLPDEPLIDASDCA
jgi:hypothetical protein